jgi:aspartate aminotransferase, cytoplasmic
MLKRGDSFTGLDATQSQRLIDESHIYLTSNGRISMAGLNSQNIRYFAEALDKVVRG